MISPRSWIGFAITLAILSAGCATKATSPAEPPATLADPMYDFQASPVYASAGPSYARYSGDAATGLLRLPDARVFGSDEWKIKIFDATGQTYQARGHIEHRYDPPYTFVEFEWPGTPPYVIVTDCGCFGYLINIPGLILGDSSLVEQHNVTLRVEAPDLQGSTPLDVRETRTMLPDTLHWEDVIVWQASGHGNVSFLRPDDSVSLGWELVRGTSYDRCCMGTRQPFHGDWNLRFEGIGTFEFGYTRYYLPPSAWPSMGLKPPSAEPAQDLPVTRIWHDEVVPRRL